MKTAMQKLIDELQKDGFKANHYGDTKTSEILYGIKDYIIENLLEKEKEQIIDAYCEGFKEGSEGNRIMPEEYYYDLYNQFIKKITITEFNQNK